MADDRDQADLEAFRLEARELGFSRGDFDQSVAGLETADEFIARMRSDERQPRRHTRRMAVLVIAAAVVAVGVAFILQPNGTPAVAARPPILDFEFAAATRIAYAPGEDPGEIFQQLSNAASNAPEPAGNGVIHYKQSDNWFSDMDNSGSSRIIPRVSETWLEPNGSLTTKESLGDALAPDGRGVQSRERGAEPKLVTQTLPPGTVNASLAASLPTKPDELASALLAQAQCENLDFGDVRSMCLYREVVALFQTYVVPPDLTAGIWSMLRSESGFWLLGSVEDRAGRPGVGIAITPQESPEYRFVLLADLSTGELLGTEELLIHRDPELEVQPPAVVSFATFTQSTLVDTVSK